MWVALGGAPTGCAECQDPSTGVAARVHVRLSRVFLDLQVDLRSLDLEASVDVRAMATSALARLTAADVALLKCLLAASLYPQVRPQAPVDSTVINTSSLGHQSCLQPDACQRQTPRRAHCPGMMSDCYDQGWGSESCPKMQVVHRA